MRSSISRWSALLLAGAALAILVPAVLSAAREPAALPNPVLVFQGAEFYEADGKQWARYRFAVANLAEYPNELFAPAPDLPPCGSNTKASRTWVDIFDQSGRRLYGFCALTSRDGLGQLWFAVERDKVPPSWAYIEMLDRRTNTKYKSNLAETTM